RAAGRPANPTSARLEALSESQMTADKGQKSELRAPPFFCPLCHHSFGSSKVTFCPLSSDLCHLTSVVRHLSRNGRRARRSDRWLASIRPDGGGARGCRDNHPLARSAARSRLRT